MRDESASSTGVRQDVPLPADAEGRGGHVRTGSQAEQRGAVAAKPRTSPVAQAEAEPWTRDELCEELEEWRERALRLQADMENYRRRQQRVAQDQIGEERNRLLHAFLGVVDDLERALAVPGDDEGLPEGVSSRDGDGLRRAAGLRRGDGLRRGVELTHRAAMQLLKKEGVTPIAAEHQPFDPNWHDAVATAPRNGSGLAPGTVSQVVEPGYRLGEQLLRPAKVVVVV